MNKEKTLTDIEQQEEVLYKQQQEKNNEDPKSRDMFEYLEWFYDGEMPDWD